MQYVGLEDIRQGTRRIAFSPMELKAAVIHIKNNRKKGLQTGIHPLVAVDLSKIMKDGFLVITADDLNTDVLFTKIDAGRGFFGGQKVLYGSYIGSFKDNLLMFGVTYKSWGIAITSINNVYRAVGLL